jgi:L-lysine 6-transaminase
MKTLFDLTIDFERSYGSYLYDKQKQTHFLDLFSLYSSLPLGYNHPVFDETFKQQMLTLSSIKMANNAFKSDELQTFLTHFTQYTFSPHIHFTSTGALAVESALKSAMETKSVKNPMIISVKNSFHGINSWGFTTDRVGVTAKRMENFPTNNWLQLSLEEIIIYLQTKPLDDLVAVLIEPIQATNGDIYLDVKQLHTIRTLCKQHNIAFILDEIQTGFGTTGKMWYYEHIDLEPDILIFGKKAQVSGIVISKEYRQILDSPYQKLDVTFDGDLLDIVRATYILRAYEDGILKNVAHSNLQFKKALENITLNYRSIGHLIAFDFSSQEKRDQFVADCFEKQLIINKAGEKTVRLRPNLAISPQEIDQALGIFLTLLETT